jgi:hypothetical protein
VKNKITLMILGSLVALTSIGARTSDSYTIGAEGLLPQTSYAAGGYVLEGTLAPVSGGSSDSYTLRAGFNPASLPGGIPLIKEDLEDMDLLEGDTLTLTIVATSNSPMTYTWSKDDVVIEGADSDTLEVAEVTNDDEGAYFVTVSNAYGEVNSLTATVSVLAKPVILVDLEDVDELEGATITLAVEAEVEGTPAYQWYKDTVAIDGETDTSIELVSVTGDDEGDYKVVISNEAGSVESSVAVVSVLELPVILTQPKDKEGFYGGSAIFRVTTRVEGTAVYAWYKDGVAIDGATAKVLSLSCLTGDDIASYTLEISNEAGSVTSDPAALTLLTPNPDQVPAALLDSYYVSASGDMTNFYSDWFGEFSIKEDSDFGWVWTDRLGWTYFTLLSTPEASYTYPLLVGGIFYISESSYPDFAFSYNDNSWVLLNPTNDASTGSIWGWVYALNDWVEYSENDQ